MNKGERYADRFTILTLAGSGGTARVYKAFDDETQSVVALKVFVTDGVDPDVIAEFWNREVKSLEAVKHDAVTAFCDAGREAASGQRYIVLEWIDGISLEEHLERTGKLGWDQFYAAIGRPVLTALVHAAERNVFHRDLSTSNIIISSTGAPKIIDFGQAKISKMSIGVTVAGWRTAPYCPPEEDTGTYTYTRDPFAFCAIAVRAIAGYQLKDHDALYSAFENATLPEGILEVFRRALNRDPKLRFSNSIELHEALEGGKPVDADAPPVVVPLRLAPGLSDRILLGDQDEEGTNSAIDRLVLELNDAVCVSPAAADPQSPGNRIELETQSYRLIADIDSAQVDHLVIVHLAQKRFRLDTLYHGERWTPNVSFTTSLPRSAADRTSAKDSLRAFYQGLEDFQTSHINARRPIGSGSVADWSRLLEALRYIARHKVPSLRYSDLQSEGSSLIATIENPEDAQEEQIRTISVEGRWVFRGEIESIVGNQCRLLSTRPRIDLTSIPSKGVLESDWQQTKVALDRQARAVERFKTNDLPNPQLGNLLTGKSDSSDEPSFALVSSFFDSTLDAAKKEVVSRCASGIDLLVTHGPPGTGKTKLIVELIRQVLQSIPDAKLLLVSQTHAALDNALERLLKADSGVSCVRIGSGSKAVDPRVATWTVEHRGRVLRDQVEAGAQAYLQALANTLGVDPREVQRGLRALDVLGLREAMATNRRRQEELERERRTLKEAEPKGTTTEASSNRVRIQVVDQEIDKLVSQLEIAESELLVATDRLAKLGSEGRELAQASSTELREWADILTEGDNRQKLTVLMELAEGWRLRFGQSDDFKAAIISSSSIVAGTCVGFCREEAASRATFDLCIIDEAGKATTTELLVPLAQSRRAVIVGDHHQLPAVIEHAVRDPELMERFGITDDQIRMQLFEELTETLGSASLTALTVQYRMRAAIGTLIGKCFYRGNLTTDDSANSRPVVDLALAGLSKSVTWVDPYYGPGLARYDQQEGTSYTSIREQQCVLVLLRRLAFVFERSLKGMQWPSIAVITGYAAHANQIRAEIRRNIKLDGLSVECATVHAFQGREVDICIYSVARRNRDFRIGMLTDWRHLNVALSRARDFLVIVGSVEFCRNVPDPNPFREIVDFIEHSSECDLTRWTDD